jgi:hypothetical protein
VARGEPIDAAPANRRKRARKTNANDNDDNSAQFARLTADGYVALASALRADNRAEQAVSALDAAVGAAPDRAVLWRALAAAQASSEGSGAVLARGVDALLAAARADADATARLYADAARLAARLFTALLRGTSLPVVCAGVVVLLPPPRFVILSCVFLS